MLSCDDLFLFLMNKICCFSYPDFEASFIRLLDKVTNGSKIEINQTGE